MTILKSNELTAFAQAFLKSAESTAGDYADRRLRATVFALKVQYRANRITRRTAIQAMLNTLELKQGSGGYCRITLLDELKERSVAA